jgi:acyl carrier protein
MKDIEFQIKKLIADECGYEIDGLNPETRLLHDLGVDGDDGIELLKAFAKKLDVDMTDLDVTKHFGPEAGFNLIYYLFTYFFHRDELKFVPITVSDMVVSAEAKKWIAPNREPEL